MARLPGLCARRGRDRDASPRPGDREGPSRAGGRDRRNIDRLIGGTDYDESSLRPLAIDIGKLWKGFPTSLARLATEICARLGARHSFTASDIPLIENTYVGSKYGVPSESGEHAIKLLARAEGILLDPVYTGKAFAGMLDLIEKGQLGSDEPILFLHTGGLPALFAF